ncbi:MAG: hydrogenase maturation protease [Phycisphaerae bacterium]|nr:hydrogenase maturation protease [Phycisphaerae bacterium]
MKETIVLGLGNPLMADEGIGIALISKLQTQADKFGDVEFVDAGTGGFNLLHYLDGRKKAIIIDCALMGTQPGTIKKFSPEDVETTKKLAHYSLHEADIIKVLQMAKMLGQCPETVIIFGIEPAAVEQRQSLSTTLLDNIDLYIEQITAELL